VIKEGDFKVGDIIIITKTHFEPKTYIGKYFKVSRIDENELHFDYLDGSNECYLNLYDDSEDANLASKAVRIIFEEKVGDKKDV